MTQAVVEGFFGQQFDENLVMVGVPAETFNRVLREQIPFDCWAYFYFLDQVITLYSESFRREWRWNDRTNNHRFEPVQFCQFVQTLNFCVVDEYGNWNLTEAGFEIGGRLSGHTFETLHVPLIDCGWYHSFDDEKHIVPFSAVDSYNFTDYFPGALPKTRYQQVILLTKYFVDKYAPVFQQTHVWFPYKDNPEMRLIQSHLEIANHRAIVGFTYGQEQSEAYLILWRLKLTPVYQSEVTRVTHTWLPTDLTKVITTYVEA